MAGNPETVLTNKNINPHELQVDPDLSPEIGHCIRIKKSIRTPSTGWVRVAPGEIGTVLDTGHVSVRAMFQSGLGVPWVGLVKDVEVMVLKPDIKENVVGTQLLNRLRGLPETKNRGRKSVGSFYGAGYYAARKRGGGMVRARVIVPHKYIGSCGFVIPNYVVSVDAVNYNDDEGCTMYVTMKPGDEQDLIPIVAQETKGTGTVTITPKQYSAGWSYYPSTSQIGGSRLQSSVAACPPSIVAVQQSHLSEAASEAYHEDFTGTHHMSSSEKQTLMRRLCKYCQSGSIRQVQPVLTVSPEVVEWINERGRGRTLLHYAGLGGSLEVVKGLLRTGASTDARDVDQARPIDLVEKYIARYLVVGGGGGSGGGSGGGNEEDQNSSTVVTDPHAHKRYRKCRALLSTTTIHTAAKEGDVDRVAFLIREHVDLLNAR